MYRLYSLFFLFAWAQAQIPYFGFCPEYVPMAHFDMNRFLGKWYEAERYFQFSEIASRCVITDYAVGPNGKIYVSNEVTNRFTGVKRVIGGNLDLTAKRTEGKMVIKYNTTPISTTSTLSILDTDYDTYAVIYSCGGIGPVNSQSAWLMTRERIPDAQTLQKAYGVLDRYKINRSFFVKTDQEGCAVAASDLNAALGIASTSTNVEQTAAIDSNSNQRERVNVKAQPIADILLNKVPDDNSASGEEVNFTNKAGVLTIVEQPPATDSNQRVDVKAQPIAQILLNKVTNENSANREEVVTNKENILPMKTDSELLLETTTSKLDDELLDKVEEKPTNELKTSENLVEIHEEEKSPASVVFVKSTDTNKNLLKEQHNLASEDKKN